MAIYKFQLLLCRAEFCSQLRPWWCRGTEMWGSDISEWFPEQAPTTPPGPTQITESFLHFSSPSTGRHAKYIGEDSQWILYAGIKWCLSEWVHWERCLWTRSESITKWLSNVQRGLRGCHGGSCARWNERSSRHIPSKSVSKWRS